MMRLAVSTVIAAAISLSAPQPPTPHFGASTNAVLVDVVIRDKTGHAVGGLSASDFIVREDGRAQPIISFIAIDGRVPSSAVATTPEHSPAATPHLPASVVLLVDDVHLTPQQAVAVRPALKTLLTRLGTQTGALSLVAPLSKVSVAGALPEAAPDLAAATDRINGYRFEDRSSFPVLDSEAFAAVNGDARTIDRLTKRFVALNPNLTSEAAAGLVQTRTAEVVHDARQGREMFYGMAMLALDWLAARDGRHELVVVSGGFAREPNDVRFNAVVTRSMHVNAPLHFVDVRGLAGLGLQSLAVGPALSPDAGHATFAFAEEAGATAELADTTGGVTVRNSNDVARGLDRVLDGMSTYYILGYEAPSPAKPGFKRIRVDVKGRGLTVNARRGYFVGNEK
jgi:VWFA-related protein